MFVYSRDAAGTEALRADGALLEEHWSYMDGFAQSMIARGPTFAADGETVTGSLHILGLPSIAAAHTFVATEPNNRAGVYAEHSIWRFENLLGRTMWEFSGPSGEQRFLVIARCEGLVPVPAESLSAGLRDRLIVYGTLATLEAGSPIGIAFAIQAGESESVRALLAAEQSLDELAEIEVQAWEFGGRR